MKQVAILPREQRDILRELSDCIAWLENSSLCNSSRAAIRHFVGRRPGDFERYTSTEECRFGGRAIHSDSITQIRTPTVQITTLTATTASD
jgi:hypothetical protein